MFHRMFEGNPPHITFTGTWEVHTLGNRLPGRTVHIAYDASRLPSERSTDGGRPAWSITAFYQFAPDGPVHTRQLAMPAGPPPVRYVPDPVEATFLRTEIAVPDDAQELILWFLNSGRSGAEYWDSADGANYVFRFTSLDIRGEAASVTSDPDAPYGGFDVSLTALPEVENVTVAFRVTNAPPGEPYEGHVPLTAGEIVEGRRAWSASGISVPRGARIRFAFQYSVGGRLFIDDNDGTGFRAPEPLPTHDPRAYAVAMQSRG